MRRALPTLLAIVILTAACGDSDDPAANEGAVGSSSSSSSTSVDAGGSETAAPAGSTSDYATTNLEGRPVLEVAPTPPGAPSQLLSEDVVAGEGATIEPGDLIEVNYLGATQDGAEFDASWDRSQTLFIQIGVGNLIAGWDEGLIGMTEGSRRLLVIPPELAYGANGAGGGAIGPDETLLFVVDLLQIVSGDAPELPDVTEVGDQLEIIDVEVGDGELVESGDIITVNYQGNLFDGTIFDSSWTRGAPFTTPIGVGQVIQGWDEGMVGMREGGRRILVIPSHLAYGEAGAGTDIGPDTPLVFVVDLLRVQG